MQRALVIFFIPVVLLAGEGGGEPSIYSVIPFVFMLLAIAILPVVVEHWWHSNWNKLLVALALGLPVGIYLVFIGRLHDVEHQLILDYVPFIALLGALFYISGGIFIKGDIRATPLNNSIFLATGALMASFVGTTGASMLLIRPLLKSNSERRHVVHTVIFFIFLVSNIGGLLTPLGDPPLFLGYLKGVPFTWTFKLAPEWLTATLFLLVLYYFWDWRAYKSEEIEDIKKDDSQREPIGIEGKRNFLCLLGVILTVAFVNEHYEPFKTLIAKSDFFRLLQVPLMLGFALLSKGVTPGGLREKNAFTFFPIVEVAFLFIGIFLTMIPALILLKTHGASLGVTHPVQYFLAAGIFSSFLDNAPTYLVFLSLAQGQNTIFYVVEQMPAILAAISVGAVFMGANTYIGNAPNFMVKSIAEENRVAMPNFGRYMLYSIGILTPVYLLIIYIFFR